MLKDCCLASAMHTFTVAFFYSNNVRDNDKYFLFFFSGLGPSIRYVRKLFRKIDISYPLIRKHTLTKEYFMPIHKSQ